MSNLSKIANEIMDKAKAEKSIKAEKESQEKTFQEKRKQKLEDDLGPIMQAYAYANNKTELNRLNAKTQRYAGGVGIEMCNRRSGSIFFAVHLMDEGEYLLKGIAFPSDQENGQLPLETVIKSLTAEISKKDDTFKRHFKAYSDKQERKKLPMLQRLGFKKQPRGN